MEIKTLTLDNKLVKKWQQASFHDKFIMILVILYLGVISAYMVWHRVFFSPDRFFIFAFLGMLLVGKAWSFFWDWLPPLILLFGYEYLRGIVPQLTSRVHVFAMINFDKFIFGVVPTIWLQEHFFNPNFIHWYDYAAVSVYFVHFISPMLIALVFWFLDRSYFKLYMVAMILLSYMGFITYLIFPAMPPWMAAQSGFLPPVAKVIDLVTAHFASPTSLPTVYRFFGANLVAAVPSLHAAYPMLTGLFFYKKFPRAGLFFFVYMVSVWVSVVYLGEHYVFDVSLGVLYALIVYGLMVNWFGVTAKIKAALVKLFSSFRRSEEAQII